MTDAKTIPEKRPFETHEGLQRVMQKIAVSGLNMVRWDELAAEIDVALATERNEAYVRGMHDEHNEPLGDRLPPLHPKRTAAMSR